MVAVEVPMNVSKIMFLAVLMGMILITDAGFGKTILGGMKTSTSSGSDSYKGGEGLGAFYVDKLEIAIKTLKRFNAAPSLEAWGKVEFDIYLNGGGMLRCPVSQLHSVGGLPYVGGTNTLTIDLADECFGIDVGEEDALTLDRIDQIAIKYDSNDITTDRWGIQAIMMTAINDSHNHNSRKTFYYNSSVWAWLAVNQLDGYQVTYPTHEGGHCMGRGARGGFGSFPGNALNITGFCYACQEYDIHEFPQGTLYFRRSDYAVYVELSADDSLHSGTLLPLHFKFEGDCGNAGYVRIFDLIDRLSTKNFRFYTANLDRNELTGFRLKLSDGGEDNLKLDYYKVSAYQAWSETDIRLKSSNVWNRMSITGCSGASECLTVEAGSSVKRGLTLSTIAMPNSF